MAFGDKEFINRWWRCDKQKSLFASELGYESKKISWYYGVWCNESEYLELSLLYRDNTLTN